MSGCAVFPTSFMQRRLWFIQSAAPLATPYNMQVDLDFPFRPDLGALQGALDDLVARHELLRTSFAWDGDEPVQCVAPEGGLPLDVHELHDPTTADHELARLAAALVTQPFQLSQAPLARVAVGIVANERARVSIVLHHIIADAQSVRVLIDELHALYHARAAGRLLVLPEPPVQYADYAVWQRQTLSGERLARLAEYWQQRLEGIAELDLPHDRPRPKGGSQQGSVRPFSIPAAVVRELRQLAAAEHATLFAAILAAFSAVLGRFTRQDTFPIGLPVTGRPRPELERVIGPFINSVVFRADVGGSPTFRELLAATHRALVDDLTHQDYPFDLVVDALRWPRRLDRNPIFQLMFQLQMLDRPADAARADERVPAPSGGLASTADAIRSQL